MEEWKNGRMEESIVKYSSPPIRILASFVIVKEYQKNCALFYITPYVQKTYCGSKSFHDNFCNSQEKFRNLLFSNFSFSCDTRKASFRFELGTSLHSVVWTSI